MTDTVFNRARDLPTAHLLGAGTAMCAGCGGLGAVREVYDVLGEDTVFVNAAGCMTMLSVYPFTPFRGSWLYTAMASAPAGAQGIRDALDIRLAKGEISKEEAAEAGAAITADGRDINNALAYPAIFRGALDARATEISLEMKIAASKKLAELAPQGSLLPDILDRAVHKQTAEAVAAAWKSRRK